MSSDLATRPASSYVAEAPVNHHKSRSELLFAVVGFVAFAVIVLTKASAMLEPDDFAYRASIMALSHGQILLSNAQYVALQHQLSADGGQGVLQWHQMASGKWISEKNPGYPFLAELFYLFDALRIAPLFYGALACVGLYAGARAWLGRFAGCYAVWLYCFSGAALVFAWRATMPTFTDASLIAAAFGALLWVAFTPESSPRRRTTVGLFAFFALEAAVFTRYTDIVELLVASASVVLLRRAARLPWRTVILWLSSVACFGIAVLTFNHWAYGSATSTGYSSGEISFSLAAVWPNLKTMPAQLAVSIPVAIVAYVSLVWIVVRVIQHHRGQEATANAARRDALVAAVLASGWLGTWLLYLSYTWTANQLGGGIGHNSGITVHVIRFYLPALGLIALLATWLLTKLRVWISWPLIAALVVAAMLSFAAMSNTRAVGGGGIGPAGAVPSGAATSTGGGAP